VVWQYVMKLYEQPLQPDELQIEVRNTN